MAEKSVFQIVRQIRSLIGGSSRDGLSDGVLLDRFANLRDETAFETLIERYGALVLGLCRRTLGNSHDAEDAFQATFLVLARKAGAIRRQNSVGSWLYGVAYRICLDAKARSARRRTHERQAAEMMGPRISHGEGPQEQESWQPVLDAELAQLPDKYRAPLLLCYLQGKTNEEASQELGWPTGSMSRRLDRARDLLRQRLARRGVALSGVMLGQVLAASTAAAVSPPLRQTTLEAVTLFASGKTVAAGAVPTFAVVLAEGALHAMFYHKLKCMALVAAAVALLLGTGLFTYQTLAADAAKPAGLPALVRTAQSGPWSAPATWEGGQVPAAGLRVQVREGHTVVYDLNSDQVLRSLHIAGTLTFARDKNTRLDVGLIKIQPSSDCSEDGFDCDAHVDLPDPSKPKPALEIGTLDQPIPVAYTARIRLVYIDGMDKETCPAIVCCGGRWDIHGAPMSRTWVELGGDAKKGEALVLLAEEVRGWRVGDDVIVTGSKRLISGAHGIPRDEPEKLSTERRRIVKLDGRQVTLDRPLAHDHAGSGDYRSEVANLSRNVIVESADPAGVRAHTMYHRYSAGGISYAEFRHLGKEDVLGKYAIHFHLVRDTMRGSGVLGASIWDSHNRWLTIHGTDYLVVRDCVGYQSVGHGFFLEDATEQYNVLDRNLGVQAYAGKPLPTQVLGFDPNDGAAFWWANGRNTLIRNVACESNQYGYRYDCQSAKGFNATLPLRMPDGERQEVDIRTIPFYRFEANESHTEGLSGFAATTNGMVSPDTQHPHIIKDLTIWNSHYAFRPQVPKMLIEGLKIHEATYAIYRAEVDHHVYRDIYLAKLSSRAIGFAGRADGHGRGGIQPGPFTYDNVTFDNIRTAMPLVCMNQTATQPGQAAHFRNLTINGAKPARNVVDVQVGEAGLGGVNNGPTYYFHDYLAAGRVAKVVSTKFPELMKDGEYRDVEGFTGPQVKTTEAKDVAFPKLLDPVDDLPPATIITFPPPGATLKLDAGTLTIRGTTTDNGKTKRVLVNGALAASVDYGFHQWEVKLTGLKPGPLTLSAHAEDEAGNVEMLPHRLTLTVK